MKIQSREMSVKAIDNTVNTRQKRLGQKPENNQHQQSFTGNPMVTVMDSISRGGFAASFIAQDGIGMVAPRIGEGMNRGRTREKDPVTGEETGKKTGPYNWAFARREGVREILSGPSAFIIPAAILAVIKKASGTANNVPIDLINTYGENFAKVVNGNKEIVKNAVTAKSHLYKEIFKEVLTTSLEKTLSGKELDDAAQDMTNHMLRIEKAESKGFFKHFRGVPAPGKKEDLIQDLVNKYMDLRKKHVAPTSNEMAVSMKVNWKKEKVETSIKKLISSLPDYANDAISNSKKFIEKNATGDMNEFIKTFNFRRSGSRMLANIGMFLAVVGFYDIIPKIYNMGIKENPDEIKNKDAKNNDANAEVKAEVKDEIGSVEKAENKKAEVAFTGAVAKLNEAAGKSVVKTNWLKKVSDKFEFDGPAMSVYAMMTLLFGFCLPPRYRDAKDHHERREIVVRDISSFTAILFGAKALSRGFSDMFAKITGLALNTKPDDHSKSIFHKFVNYVTPVKGINVLSSDQIIAKYSNLEQYKDGISGLFEYLKANGGDPKKVLAMDKGVKEAAEKILGGKSLKDATLAEIESAFVTARKEGSKALDSIYEAFKKPNNKFVNRAKTCNSAFEFASIILLVPAFMIWLARYCERMTKRNKEQERLLAEAKGAPKAPTSAKTESSEPTLRSEQIPPVINASKPTMSGFLKR